MWALFKKKFMVVIINYPEKMAYKKFPRLCTVKE